MRHHAGVFTAAAAAVLVASAATACSSGDTTGSAVGGSTSDAPPVEAVAKSSSATVDAKSEALGKILVDDKGRTLYLFEADKSAKPTCAGGCATQWPPLIVKGKPTAGSGVEKKLLSTTRRGDGTRQVTYDHHPLYLFAGDPKAGSTNGQGLNNFGAKWYVVGTNGKQITAKPSHKPSGSY